MEHDAEQQATEAPAPRRGVLVLIVALVIGVGVGGPAGLFVAGPAVAEWVRGAAAGHGGDEEEAGHGAARARRSGSARDVQYTVESLVVNPADSRGTRFLMATVVFEVDLPEAVEELRYREPQVRDALIELLGSKTIDELSDVGRRDSLRAQLRATVTSLLPSGRVGSVYLSQFVIQ